jgi:hypothetical protein
MSSWSERINRRQPVKADVFGVTEGSSPGGDMASREDTTGV